MKYLHVMPPSQRMLMTYIEMLRHNFPARDHKILLSSPISKNDAGLLLFDNVQPYEGLGRGKLSKFLHINREFRTADRIVFHSFMPTKSWTLALLLNQEVLDKSIWVIWGVDMYNYRRSEKGLHGKVINAIGRYFRSRMKYPVVVSEADIAEYDKRIGSQKVLYAPYAYADMRFHAMDKAMAEREKEDRSFEIWAKENGYEQERTFNIQVCHNGFPFNNHYEVLNYLDPLCSGLESDKIMLHVPLSYGDGQLSGNVSYVDALDSYLSQKYIGKVNVIRDLMPNNEYTQFLSKMDVAIFNASRHNALGNILQLLYMGKKVYLSSKSPLLEYLRCKGFVIHEVSELKGITLEELKKKDNSDQERAWIRKAFGVDTMLKMWRNIFAYSEEKIDYETAWRNNLSYVMSANEVLASHSNE